ncbi:hypothetical protein B0H21DRAFT_865863 [Amylocystis lapponica]|nr:hypothetical protein B0H21DRAFT_865863 [Amylocystis lapponica]
MVHRPADSRLLSNLLSHEKDYSKHFASILDYSQASLASFSAYASASAPPTSQVIIAVAGAIAGADEALRKYVVSLDQWQQQLKALKDLEEEVGNIMRDREILVTRLIKASKQQKPTRDNLLGASPSTSSLSFSKPEILGGTKLSTAQAELQACEAHLASKERELDGLRVSAMQRGLQGRCTAMVECGWAWGEMGKEGLRALSALDTNTLQNGPKPLPDPSSDLGHPPSDLSSIAPSQSASQIAHDPDGSGSTSWHGSPLPQPPTSPPIPYTLHIPPAHSIADFAVPNGRISEEDEEGAGSSADEDEDEDAAAVEVHENARFAKGGKPSAPDARAFSIRGTRERTPSSDAGHHVHFRPPSPSSSRTSSGRQRTVSSSVFGNIAAFFHHRDKARDGPPSDGSAAAGRGGRWQTRTDRHLAQKRHSDESSDDDGARRAYQSSTAYLVGAPRTDSPHSMSSPIMQNPNSSMQRLRKKVKRGSAQMWSDTRDANDVEKGWQSEGATSGAGTMGKEAVAQGKRTRISTDPQPTRMNGSAVPAASTSRTPGIVRGKKPLLSGGVPHDTQVSQSMTSSVSAPHPAPSANRRRTSSLEITVPGSPSSPSSTAAHPMTHKRALSVASPPASRSGLTRNNEQPSLMSIVEGVTRQNKAAWMRQDPNRMLVVPKAPPPIRISIDEAGERPPLAHPSSPLARNPALLSASVSAPTLPSPQAAGRQPAKMPLRSALRNSRTPSPNPAAPLALDGAVPAKSVVSVAVPEKTGEPVDGVAQALAALTAKMNGDGDGDGDGGDDDASISSYETGREGLDDDEPEPVPPPPPPPHDPPHAAGGSELSNSTASTATAPVRRKSVRMSLPPTFSVTPPARRGRHAPWDTRGRSGAPAAGEGADVWANSSDEDEEYNVARRLLSRASRRARF